MCVYLEQGQASFAISVRLRFDDCHVIRLGGHCIFYNLGLCVYMCMYACVYVYVVCVVCVIVCPLENSINNAKHKRPRNVAHFLTVPLLDLVRYM